MAILIDMDMPKRCEECEFYKHNSGYDFVYCFLTATNIMGCANARLDNCPLRELVKCKDCKHWGQDGYKEGCKYAVCIVTENDWCSFAERREE